MTARCDVAIIGGGIVGLATAWAIKENHPSAVLAVLEKEGDWAQHQTGHNSGVIHSGIYYKPGSLKARLCRAGNRSMIEFCRRFDIEHEICGKVIVATREDELPELHRLYERGIENALHIKLIDPGELREIEPHVRGLAAIRVLDAGIVDYRVVCRKLASVLEQRGCQLNLNHEVTAIDPRSGFVHLRAGNRSWDASFVVNCAGLHCDRVAALSGVKASLQIVPFRGEYYQLRRASRHLVRGLIYPVPDLHFPFLGVHYTRMIGGHVEAGPNAVLALAREGYRKTDVNLADLREILGFKGFRALARKHWKAGAREMWRSLSKAAFVRSLQELIPAITAADLVPAPAGIRAQALRSDGSLVDDFEIIDDGHCVHICNAPSPAATASLEIGKHIAGLLHERIRELRQE